MLMVRRIDDREGASSIWRSMVQPNLLSSRRQSRLPVIRLASVASTRLTFLCLESRHFFMEQIPCR